MFKRVREISYEFMYKLSRKEQLTEYRYIFTHGCDCDDIFILCQGHYDDS